MRHLIVLAGLIGLVACSPDASVEEDGIESPIAMTLIDGGMDSGGGPWSLTIESQAALTPQSRLFAFSRSENDYRRASWSALSGATFEREAGFDTIRLTEDLAQFEFTPHTTPLPGTYTPFIQFSDGGIAVFLGQFDMFGLPDEAALSALKGDVTNNTHPLFAAPLTIKSSRPMLYGGTLYQDSLTVELDGNVSYAFLGDTPLTQGESFSGVIDPGLPDWISARFDQDLTTLLSALEARWGFGLDDKATILLAFEGYDVEGVSMTGGALPGNMISMQISGSRLREENPRITSYLKWFFTHEVVHLFQHKTGKGYAHNRFSWINEGGANTMTSMIMVEQNLAIEGYLLKTYADSFKFCAEALEGKTLAQAIEAGPEGNYDCGDLIGRITDAALPDHDYFGFWNAFLGGLSENFTDEDYFQTMRKLGADEAVVTRLETLTRDPVAKAPETLKALMDDVGIKTSFKDGEMTAITFPD